MSFFPGKDPAAGDRYACDALEVVVVPRSADLGGFSVRRALPHTTRRSVGPFVFFDHFGPAEFKAGNGLDVRPHPHIGLSTLTYLYEGEIMHRDTLGISAPIRPGEVNWMTAGRGIVHSERTAPERRVGNEPLHGLQFWLGMPSKDEEIAPGFTHLDGAQLPIITVSATQPSRIAALGGTALDGPRYIWWNFVSSRKERIQQAKEEWKQGRFGKVPGDEIEFIPLPEDKPYTAE